MPTVDGGSLRDKLDREGQLSIEESVTIAIGVAEALDYAHRQNVVHRDIKPENILLHEGKPLVVDFGIALAVSHVTPDRITATGVSLGTPSYMSPEQAAGNREVTARADVYALAAVLYDPAAQMHVRRGTLRSRRRADRDIMSSGYMTGTIIKILTC